MPAGNNRAVGDLRGAGEHTRGNERTMDDPSGSMHIVNLMRRMHTIDEERREVLQELSAWGSPGLHQSHRHTGSSENFEETHDLVALWTETSETLQGIIAEKEARLDDARARSVLACLCGEMQKESFLAHS